MTDSPLPTGDAAPPPAQVPDAPPAPPAPVTAPAVAGESPERTDGPAPGVEFAPHGGRLVAYIIDTIIISLLFIVVIIIATPLILSGATTSASGRVTALGPSAAIGFLVLLVGFVMATLYFPFFWARGGQTLGMKPFSLRVVRDRDGSRIGWGTAFLRLIGLYVAAAVFYIGYIWIFVDKRHRGWQDLIAGTVVVKQS
jgi:uncharacterized RDD family membrane protein YckC